MEQITIKYSISRTVALLEGKSSYGSNEYKPSDTELQFLDIEHRKYLNSLNLKNVVFDLATGQPPTWPVIVEAIMAHKHSADLEQEKKATERESKILAILAEPDEKWLFFSRRFNEWHPRLEVPGVSYLDTSWVYQDSRIKTRLESLKEKQLEMEVEAKCRNDKENAEREVYEANRKAEIEEQDRVKQAAIDDVYNWCIEHGPENLARGAREGYDVVGGYVQHVANQIKDLVVCNDVKIIREGTDLWNRYNWNVRKSPSSIAFEMFDNVSSVVASFEHADSVSIIVKKIMLVEIEPSDYDEYKKEYTGIVVSVTNPACAERAVIFRAE